MWPPPEWGPIEVCKCTPPGWYLRRVPGVDEVLRKVAAPLSTRTEAVVQRVLDRTYAEVPGYRGVPRDDLERASHESAAFVFSMFGAGRAPNTEEEWQFDEEVVRRRLGQGVGATDWLAHAGVFAEEVQAEVLEVGRELGIPDGEITAVVMEIWSVVQQSVSFTAARFEQAARERLAEDADQRLAFVAGVLRGTLPPAAMRAGAAGVNLDPDALHVTVRARTLDPAGASDLLGRLLRSEPTVGFRGVWAELDGDVCGLATKPPEAAEGEVMGVGPRASIEAGAESFADATAALETAWRFKRTGAHTLEDLGLLPTVITSGRVGDRVSERLVDAVAREGPAGEALVETVSAYLERGLQAGETAKALHLHPNSLRKRLRRYEELTGVDLHNMDDLAAIWWALKRKEIAA